MRGTGVLSPQDVLPLWPYPVKLNRRPILSYRLGAPVAVRLNLGGLVLVLPSIYTGGKPADARIAFRHEPLASVPAAPAIGAAEDHDRFCLDALDELADTIIEHLFASSIERCDACTGHPDRIGDRTMSGQP